MSNLIVGQIIVLCINEAQKLRSSLEKQKKKTLNHIKYKNNSGFPVKMQLLKAIRIA